MIAKKLILLILFLPVFHSFAQTDSLGWYVETLKDEEFFGFIADRNQDSLTLARGEERIRLAWEDIKRLKRMRISLTTFEEFIPRHPVAESFNVIGTDAQGLRRGDHYFKSIIAATAEFGFGLTDNMSVAADINLLFLMGKMKFQTRFLVDDLHVGGGLLFGNGFTQTFREENFLFLGGYGKATFGNEDRSFTLGTGIISDFGDNRNSYQNIGLRMRVTPHTVASGEMYRLKLGQTYENRRVNLFVTGARGHWRAFALGAGLGIAFIDRSERANNPPLPIGWVDFSFRLNKLKS
ncbi:MAG: hypothetical protein AAF740_13815 [Bacteroidota bacterium]